MLCAPGSLKNDPGAIAIWPSRDAALLRQEPF